VTPGDYAMVAALWLGYAALATLSAWGASRAARNATGWKRRALVCFVLAVFFSPSVVGGGHGGGIGPAWLALFQMFPMKLGVLPIMTTFLIIFGVVSAVTWLREAKTAN
jgi:hypothetical protein